MKEITNKELVLDSIANNLYILSLNAPLQKLIDYEKTLNEFVKDRQEKEQYTVCTELSPLKLPLFTSHIISELPLSYFFDDTRSLLISLYNKHLSLFSASRNFNLQEIRDICALLNITVISMFCAYIELSYGEDFPKVRKLIRKISKNNKNLYMQEEMWFILSIIARSEEANIKKHWSERRAKVAGFGCF